MARPRSTPPLEEVPEEVITPLQKFLTGTFVLSIVLVPLFAFGLYLAPFYKAEGALYRGTYFVIGIGAAVAFSALVSFVWMSYLPGLLERRHVRHAEREAQARASKRESDRKARTDAAALKRRASEEE